MPKETNTQQPKISTEAELEILRQELLADIAIPEAKSKLEQTNTPEAPDYKSLIDARMSRNRAVAQEFLNNTLNPKKPNN